MQASGLTIGPALLNEAVLAGCLFGYLEQTAGLFSSFSGLPSLKQPIRMANVNVSLLLLLLLGLVAAALVRSARERQKRVSRS